MTCHNCKTEAKKRGKDRKGNQRYYCATCFKSFIEPQENLLDGMYLPIETAALCIALLVEGNSLRSTERLTGVSLHTLLKLLVVAGEKCEQLLENRIKDVPVRDVECDEIWAFIQMKQKTVKKNICRYEYGEEAKIGDAFTFVGFERNTKLVLAWHLGKRTFEDTWAFTKSVF